MSNQHKGLGKRKGILGPWCTHWVTGADLMPTHYGGHPQLPSLQQRV